MEVKEKKPMKTCIKVVLILSAIALILASCAPGPNGFVGTPNNEGQTAGFWLGLWHGIIAPISFIVSLFNHGVNLYEAHNSGGWYNFGYVLGLSIIFGGGTRGAAGGARRCKRHND
jgi:hypothetical protein